MFCLECTRNTPGLMMLKSYFLRFVCLSAYLAFCYFAQVFPAYQVHVTTRTLCFEQPKFAEQSNAWIWQLRKCNWLDVKQRERQWQQLFLRFSALHRIWIIMLGLDYSYIIIIIHQTHYEKSDWSRTFNQFTIACELDMINAISAADIAFIMSRLLGY